MKQEEKFLLIGTVGDQRHGFRTLVALFSSFDAAAEEKEHQLATSGRESSLHILKVIEASA